LLKGIARVSIATHVHLLTLARFQSLKALANTSLSAIAVVVFHEIVQLRIICVLQGTQKRTKGGSYSRHSSFFPVFFSPSPSALFLHFPRVITAAPAVILLVQELFSWQKLER